MKFNLFALAIKYVSWKLRNDSELFNVYKDNIAVNFTDEFARQRKDGGYYVDSKEAHLIANNAAKNFLNNWIKK